MSFGFSNGVSCIEEAITQARNRNGIRPIFMAAAANDGANRPEMFPAILDTVISVRGTDATGEFISRYNPTVNRHQDVQQVYGTLGQDVFCGWLDDSKQNDSWKMSGCSIATPILAAIAALIIQSVDASEHPITPSQKLKFRCRKGITAVMQKLSVCQKKDRFYVTCWDLFDKTGDLGGVQLLKLWTWSTFSISYERPM
jgi:hypothetical protein